MSELANTEGMKAKFTVIKNEDVLSLPNGLLWMEKLKNVGNVVNVTRHPKPVNTYLVINTDEPYADEVIEIMKRHGHWG